MSPSLRNLFTPVDTAVWGALCLGGLAAAIGAHLTPQNPPIPLPGWIALWSAVAGLWLVTVLFFRRRWQLLSSLHFTTKHAVIVGWKRDEYAVDKAAVEVQLDELLRKVSVTYPGAEASLRGCLVYFVEPTWLHGGPGLVTRKVAGIQDGMFLYIGWHTRLAESALQHELMHRVLQLCAGDPLEAESHRLMLPFAL